MPARRKKRKLNSRRTKATLLDAARYLLTRHGYDKVTGRDIAARAGFDPVLLRRYFGSMPGIFAAAIRGSFDATPLLAKSGSSLAARLARLVLEPARNRPALNPIRLAARSASSAEVRNTLSRAIEREFLDPLAAALKSSGRGGARTRVTAALAILTGFDLIHNVLGIELLGKPQGRKLLLDLLRLCLDG